MLRRGQLIVGVTRKRPFALLLQQTAPFSTAAAAVATAAAVTPGVTSTSSSSSEQQQQPSAPTTRATTAAITTSGAPAAAHVSVTDSSNDDNNSNKPQDSSNNKLLQAGSSDTNTNTATTTTTTTTASSATTPTSSDNQQQQQQNTTTATATTATTTQSSAEHTLMDVGMTVSAFAECGRASSGLKDPIAFGKVTTKLGSNVFVVTFDHIPSSSSPFVEMGSRVIVTTTTEHAMMSVMEGAVDVGPPVLMSGLVAKVYGNGVYAVLYDDDQYDANVQRHQIIHTEGLPKFVGFPEFQDLRSWIKDAGVEKKADCEATTCILYRRGWRTMKMYLLEESDVSCLRHLNNSVRKSLLEKAQWERDAHRHERDMATEILKEKEWKYVITKYSGVFSAVIAFCGVCSVFLWNFTNYKKTTRSFQLDAAIHSLTLAARQSGPSTARSIRRLLGEPSVSRSTETDKLTEILARLDVSHPRIIVVTGLHGCGKSSITRSAVQNCRFPTVYVDIRDKDDPIRSIVKSMGVTNIDVCGDLLDFIAEVCSKGRSAIVRDSIEAALAAADTDVASAAALRKSAAKRQPNIPTIVIRLRDVDLKRIYNEAVVLAVDRRVCHVIIEADNERLGPEVAHMRNIDVVGVSNFNVEHALAYVPRRVDPLAVMQFHEVVGGNASELDELIAAVVHRDANPFQFTKRKLLDTIHLFKTHCPRDSKRYEFLKEMVDAGMDKGLRYLSFSAGEDPFLRGLVYYCHESGLWKFVAPLYFHAAATLR